MLLSVYLSVIAQPTTPIAELPTLDTLVAYKLANGLLHLMLTIPEALKVAEHLVVICNDNALLLQLLNFRVYDAQNDIFDYLRIHF